jgi:hypothetical protein
VTHRAFVVGPTPKAIRCRIDENWEHWFWIPRSLLQPGTTVEYMAADGVVVLPLIATRSSSGAHCEP